MTTSQFSFVLSISSQRCQTSPATPASPMEEHTPHQDLATAITRDHQTTTILATTDQETSRPLPPGTEAATPVHPAAKTLSTKGPARTNGPLSCRRN